MFSTGRRRYQHLQQQQQQQHRESSPPPGSDSCYGVRSLEGSICSEATSSSPAFPPSVPVHSGDEDENSEEEDEHRSEGEGSETKTPMVDQSLLLDSPGLPILTLPFTSTIPFPTDGHEDSTVSVSPDDTLHPLDRGRNAGRDSRAELNHRLSLAHLPSPTSTGSNYNDMSSVPSSPASVSFSCIASLSSVSRTSSPVSGTGYT